MSPTLNKLITFRDILSKKIPSFSLLVNLYLLLSLKSDSPLPFQKTSEQSSKDLFWPPASVKFSLNDGFHLHLYCCMKASNSYILPQLALKVQGQTLASIPAVNATLLLILL